LLDWIDLHDEGFRLVMAGHRVVHGGQTFTEPAEITPTVMTEMDRLAPLAPMHQPHSIAAVQAISGAKPELRQIACFDTSFHPTQPRVAQLYALARSLSDMGILKYGFHGVSYDYIASVLPQHAPDVADGRIIVAHLGSGASM
jgi:acetate kinase